MSNKTKKQDMGEITKQPEIKPLPDISNPEKMFFKNGTLADMKPKALYNLIEINDEDKIQNRADILYGNDEEYIKKYYGKDKEINSIKRYENMALDNLEQKIPERARKISEIKSNNAKFSDEEIKRAREFIQGEEKFKEYAYKPTPNDVWTIGYGHTGNVDGKPITEGMRITKEKAEELYRKDFEVHIQPLKNIEVPLTSNQKIALASFAYNMGPRGFINSDVFKKINSGDYQGTADEFGNYVKQKNKETGEYEILKGLVRRRKKEKELFLTPDRE